MRGDTVFRVYGIHEGREKDVFFGAFRSRGEAESTIDELRSKEMHGRSWSQEYHNKGFVIRSAVVETDFEVPEQPKPRDKFVVQCSRKPNQPGTWDSTQVEVYRRAGAAGLEELCSFERNYSMLQTFEPFRQKGREFALISQDYTKTAVLDLSSGRIVAEEKLESEPGFCPVGFYVPDWWDLHDGSVIPGSEHWNADCEWPDGEFGFVWGCLWGDDTSWKVQYLDLGEVGRGSILRDERFGYVELATSGYTSPCLKREAPSLEGSSPPPFIRVSRSGGATEVHFAVEMTFDLDSGQSKDWRRFRAADFE